jgi:choline dehydrogenase
MTKAVLQHLLFSNGPLSNSPLEANAFLKSDESLDRPDIQFHFVPLGIAEDYSTDIYDLKTFSHRDGFAILSILIRPESRGYIGLKSSKPTDAPMIQPNLLSDPRDKQVVLKALRKAMEVMTAPSLQGYAVDGLSLPQSPHTDEDLWEHIKKSAETLYHPVGTCKMGNDAMAVVNDHLQVYGVKNLRVIDASVMPTIISGNTNAATVMIAEKGADLILEAHSA